MPDKSYKKEETTNCVSEPTVAYSAISPVSSVSDKWNPNVPFHGTQEEWWEHFKSIEKGNFMTLEEFDFKFETWRREYLAKKLK